MDFLVNSALIVERFLGVRNDICSSLLAEEPTLTFRGNDVNTEGVLSLPRVLSGGQVFEKAAVLFTHARGDSLPPAASVRHPKLAGVPYEAISLSVIVHPRNPYVPSAHFNVRAFLTTPFDDEAVWWFGGGMDLSPIYTFQEDVYHWHSVAHNTCERYGQDLYRRFKANCDEYFFMPHRCEMRGAGGIFFDDFSEGGFGRCFALACDLGESFSHAYFPIVNRRKNTAYGDRERSFQLYRRGRYVEFILLYDRGVRYGLQSGRRVESVLACLPPLAEWSYDPQWVEGSPEATHSETFLTPHDWIPEEEHSIT